MIVYTSITKSYLPKARVLAKSVKKFHPDYHFVLLYSDSLPLGFDLRDEPFDEILTIDQLGFPNWKAWAFGHAVVELCTAVKGPAAALMAKREHVDKIMYLDPDIKVFASLKSLELMLDEHDILLTPHLLDIEQEVGAVMDNEISALKHGVYNLGFFAAKTSGQGLLFIEWWAERLRFFCRDDIPGGLFTDQRWCDLAPAFFSKLAIIRDRGCNVATWNIAHRRLSKDPTGVFFVADVPLRFYHFTSYDSGAGFGMLERYASDQSIAKQLWETYGKELQANGQGEPQYNGWSFGHFENGQVIPLKARRLYQQRADLQATFPEPYSTTEPCFQSWWNAEVAQGSVPGFDGPDTKKRTVVGQAIKGVFSPRYGFRVAKSVVVTIRNEGVSGLIRRMRNYS